MFKNVKAGLQARKDAVQLLDSACTLDGDTLVPDFAQPLFLSAGHLA